MLMARRLKISAKVLPWWHQHNFGKQKLWSLIPYLPNPPLLIDTTRRAALLHNVEACDHRPPWIHLPPYHLVNQSTIYNQPVCHGLDHKKWEGREDYVTKSEFLAALLDIWLCRLDIWLCKPILYCCLLLGHFSEPLFVVPRKGCAQSMVPFLAARLPWVVECGVTCVMAWGARIMPNQ